MFRSARVDWMVRLGLVIGLLAAASAQPLQADELVVLKLKLKQKPGAVEPGSAFMLTVVGTLLEAWHVNAHKPDDEFLIPTVLSFEPAADLTPGQPVYPEPHSRPFKFSENPLLVYEKSFEISIPVAVAGTAQPGIRRLVLKLQYQACNDERCLPPDTLTLPVDVQVGSGGGLITAPAAGQAPVAGQGQEGGLSSWKDIGGVVSRHGYPLAFVVTFLLGLVLAGSPCVYPIIPITVGFFLGQGDQARSQGLRLASVFVLGMAITYSVLGILAALGGRALGAALQQPFVLVGLALLMIALATSMFGLWEFGIPSFLSNRLGSSKQGSLGALVMGLTMGVVVAPCVGPFVAGLIAFVAKKADPLLGVGMFFTLSLGLGFPFLILGAGLMKLPRSGEWMLWIRKFFGFVLLGMALYFIRPLIPAIFWWALAAVALVGAVYLGLVDRTGSGNPGFERFKRIAGLAFAAMAVLCVLVPTAFTKPGIPWQKYTRAREDSARAANRPIVIDFTAEWCIPCKQLEAETFTDESVMQTAAAVVPLKADATTGGTDDVKEAVERLEVAGFPTVIFLDCQGNELKDLRVLGFVEPEDFRGRLETLLQSGDGCSG